MLRRTVFWLGWVVVGTAGLVYGAEWNAWWAGLAVVNVVTAVAYGWDKALAKHVWWRVPEVTLHLLELMGGAVMGWIVGEVIRHKTRDVRFRRWRRGIMGLQGIGAAVWLGWRLRSGG